MRLNILQYQVLINTLTYEARNKPCLYKFRVATWVMFGYLYLLFVILLSLGLLAGLFLIVTISMNMGRYIFAAWRLLIFIIPVILALLTFIFTLVSSLFIKIPEPEGLYLERGQSLHLFRDIAWLRERMDVPEFDEILLTSDYNAAVTQVPRFGLFGGHKNILVIGLPLMLSVSHEQFRAVLAHEMGHIAGAHGKFGVWLWRQLDSWDYIMMALEETEQDNSLVSGFYRFYLPRLWLRGFALNRLYEYEADKIAARAVGAEMVAESTVQLMLAEREYQDRAEGNLEVPDDKQRTKWLNQLMEESDPLHDPHPCLANNLRSLGVAPRLPPPFAQSAAEIYFTDRLAEYTVIFGIPVAPQREGGPQMIDVKPEPTRLPAEARPAPTPGVMRQLGE
jgi:Zn-dependent protease with chaperone function